MSIGLILAISGPTKTYASKRCVNKIKDLSITNIMICDILCCLAQVVVISFFISTISVIAIACSPGGTEARFLLCCVTPNLVTRNRSSIVDTS
jgi:hypothetical protein